MHYPSRTHLVCIATHARHPLHPKIKWLQLIPDISLCVHLTTGKTSAFKEGNYERSKTAVNVETNVMPQGDLAEGYDVVLVAIREVDGGANDLV